MDWGSLEGGVTHPYDTGVASLLRIGDRHWRILATTFEKAELAYSLRLHNNGRPLIWCAYFCMGGCLFTQSHVVPPYLTM